MRSADETDRALLEEAVSQLAKRGGDPDAPAPWEDPQVRAVVFTADSGRQGVAFLGVHRWALGGRSPALWVAGGYAERGATAAEMAAGLRLLRRFARAEGCRSVEFSGIRPGWRRRARQLGFAPSATVYAQETR